MNKLVILVTLMLSVQSQIPSIPDLLGMFSTPPMSYALPVGLPFAYKWLKFL